MKEVKYSLLCGCNAHYHPPHDQVHIEYCIYHVDQLHDNIHNEKTHTAMLISKLRRVKKMNDIHTNLNNIGESNAKK